MEFTHTQIEGIELVRVAGKLDFASSVEFDERLRAIVETPGQRFIILDLADVSALSSPSLRAILALAKRIVRVEGRVVVARPSEVALECFKISGFLKLNIFTVENTVETSIEKLQTVVAKAVALPVKPAAAAPQASAAASQPTTPAARSNPLLGGSAPPPPAGSGTSPPSAAPVARTNPLLGGSSPASAERANPLLGATPPASAPPPPPLPASTNPLLGGEVSSPATPTNPLLAAKPAAPVASTPAPSMPVEAKVAAPPPPPSPASTNPLLGGVVSSPASSANPLLAAKPAAPVASAPPAAVPPAAKVERPSPPPPPQTPTSAFNKTPEAKPLPLERSAPASPPPVATNISDESSDALGLKETVDYWLGKIGLKKSEGQVPHQADDGGEGAKRSSSPGPSPATEEGTGGLGGEIKGAINYWLGRLKGKQ